MNAHQEIEQQANSMLSSLYLEKANQIHNYYQRRKGDETLQVGFASVGFPDEDIDIDQIFQIIQPGFLFEVIVTNKNSKKRRLEVILQKFLCFCDKCQSSQCKQKYGDFSQFKQKKHLLPSLNQISNMRIRGVIYESEVIEDFSIFNYYINYDKIAVGDHLNAVLLDKQSMAFTLKNKSILGAKQWSLQNLQSPSTFDNQLCFRLGYSKSIGLNFQISQLNKEEQEKFKNSICQNLKFKEDTGILKMDYQIKQDNQFQNKQNYNQMLKSLGINQVSSFTSKNNLKSFIEMNLDHRRRLFLNIYFLQTLQPVCRPQCSTICTEKPKSIPLRIQNIQKIFNVKQYNIIQYKIIQYNGQIGLGVFKQCCEIRHQKVLKFDIISKVDKKINIWEKAGEANDIHFIPDADDEKQVQNQMADAGMVIGQKLQGISELVNLAKITSLPQPPDDDIDFSILTQAMRPFEDVIEIDEIWGFTKLKTEMQEIVSKLYTYNAAN